MSDHSQTHSKNAITRTQIYTLVLTFSFRHTHMHTHTKMHAGISYYLVLLDANDK